MKIGAVGLVKWRSVGLQFPLSWLIWHFRCEQDIPLRQKDKRLLSISVWGQYKALQERIRLSRIVRSKKLRT